MDMQLQDLLDKIRREGLEAAEAERAKILAEAAATRAGMIEAAKKEALAITESARSDAARAEEAGRAALAQASRDFLLAFRAELEATLAAAVADKTRAALGPEVLAEAIPLAVKGLASGGTADLSVLLPPALLSKMEAAIPSMVAAGLGKNVGLKASPGIDAGFRVVEKDGAAYYDFSAGALADLFASRLNEKLAATIRNAAKGL